MFLPPDVTVPAHPSTRSCPADRSHDRYVAVLNQFDVEHSERYRVRDTSGDGKADTFCNIFATDCANAMGVELPHWWKGRELSANGLIAWLKEHGPDYGWEKLPDAHVAVGCALAAMFTVATWSNPAGPGHIAVLLPMAGEDGQPWIAQAGRTNFAHVRLVAGFGKHPVEFFTCR